MSVVCKAIVKGARHSEELTDHSLAWLCSTRQILVPSQLDQSTEMSSAAVAPAPAAATGWVRLEYEGPNNSLGVMRLHVGQRVRVETDGAVAAGGAAAGGDGSVAVSTEDELACTAKATVRYIGPVAAARDPTAMMVGVEWDEGSARGKNDGAVGGHRYFSCASAPPAAKAASFIHPARIKHGEPGSLLSAIERKYETRFKQDAGASLYLVAEYNKHPVPAAAAGAPAANGSVPSPTASPPPSGAGAGAVAPARHIPVVFQGEEYMQNKIASQLASLVDMTLTQGHIASAFEPQLPTAADANDKSSPPEVLPADVQADLLARKISQVATLDLTDNLMRDWSEVGRICSTLPTLKLLALSSNNMLYSSLFSPLSSAPAAAALSDAPLALLPALQSSFSHLAVLVLNGVPDAWGSVLALALRGALPDLGELHLCKNQITSLSGPLRAEMRTLQPAAPAATADDSILLRSTLAKAFAKVHTIELSFNKLMEWNEVSLLERLPLLSKLLLNSNQITSVEYEASKSSDASSSDSPSCTFAALQSLGLNFNSLSSFSSVDALDRFPSLKEVRLQANAPLEALTMSMNAAGSAALSSSSSSTATTAATDPFQLAISRVLNTVSEDEAHKLVSSVSLDANASSVPCAGLSSAAGAAPIAFAPSAQSASLLRLQLVARLPKLAALNRSRITERERVDAEKYYLIVCFQAFQRMSPNTTGMGNDAEPSAQPKPKPIEQMFTRYAELVLVHGDPAATVSALQKQMIEPQGSTLASKLVEVTMLLAEHEGGASGSGAGVAAASAGGSLPSLPGLRVLSSATKKLSSSLTVQAARMLLDKTFKIAAHKKAAYTMHWREAERADHLHPLDEPLKSLSYFGVTNGAFIVLLHNK